MLEILEKFLRPEIIGPLIGMVAVIGGICMAAIKLHLQHQERIEKIRAGINPDSK